MNRATRSTQRPGGGTAKVPPVHVGTATPAVQAPRNCRSAAQLHPRQHPQQQPKSSPASPRQVGKPKLQGSESPQPTAQAFLGIELIRGAIVSTLLLKTIPRGVGCPFPPLTRSLSP